MGLTCRNQLTLPQGTETKPQMQKNGEQAESILSVWEKERTWWEGFVKEVSFEQGVKECRSYG